MLFTYKRLDVYLPEIDTIEPMKTAKHVTDSKALLWTAVEKWCVAKWGRVNLSRLATESGIGLGTAARLKDHDVTIGLDKVQAIASCFGVSLWQFLDPATDPTQPLTTLSPEATELARAFDKIADPAAKRKTYAVAAQVIEFAQTPTGFAPSVP